MVLESPHYESSRGGRMRRDVLMLITGTFSIGGGVAAVNLLVIKALTEWKAEGCQLTILALHKSIGRKPDFFYLKPKQDIWKSFGGNVLTFTIEAWR